MARNLSRIKIREVSLVNAPANRKKFLIIKEEKCPGCGGILKQLRIGEDDSCTQLKCSGCAKVYENSINKGGVVMDKLKELFKELTGEVDSGWSKLTDNAQAKAEQQYIANSDKSAAEASAEFNALSDVEKLKSISVDTSNQEEIDFYANQVWSGFIGESQTPYFDVPTAAQLEEDENAQGTPRYDKVPAPLRTAVEKKFNETFSEALQQQKAEAGDEEAKSMNPKQWFNYFFGK